jgi:hypothetical protein
VPLKTFDYVPLVQLAVYESSVHIDI